MTAIIHRAAALRCTTEQAYDLFATEAGLRRWLAPECAVEPALGGAYELFWNPANHEVDSTIGCVITALEPGSVIAFDWRGPALHGAVMNAADPLTQVAVFVRPRQRTRTPCTDVTILHTGWGGGDAWEAARRWQEVAWVKALESLERLVNATGLDYESGAAGGAAGQGGAGS